MQLDRCYQGDWRIHGRATLLHHLRQDKDGSPKHPLYIAATTKPQRFKALQMQHIELPHEDAEV